MKRALSAGVAVLAVLGAGRAARAQCVAFPTSLLQVHDLLGNPVAGDVQLDTNPWTFRRSDRGRELLVWFNTGQGFSVWGAPDQAFGVPWAYPRCSPIPAQNELTFFRRTPSFEGIFFHPGFTPIDVLAVLRPPAASTITGVTLQAELLGSFSPDLFVSVVLERPGGNVTLIPPTAILSLAPAQTLVAPSGLMPQAFGVNDRLVVRSNAGNDASEDWGNINATVQLQGPPLVYQHPVATAGCAGFDSATLSVAQAGATTLRWRRNGVPLSDGPTGTGSTISGATTATLSISPLTLADAGGYDCLLTNGCGQTVTGVADLQVPCCPDVNRDGNVDQDDVSYLINVVGGGANPTGVDPDFNQDGNVDQDDVSALINAVAGGGCP